MIDLSSLVGTFVFGVILLLTYKVYIWPYYISPLRKIPGPPSENLFYGNLKTYFAEEAGEPHLRWVKKYGNIVKYHGFLNRPMVLVADAKLIQDIALNQVYDFIKPPRMLAGLIKMTGIGLLTAEGEAHKRQRKMMNPAFNHYNIKKMVPTLTRVTWKLKSLIEDKVNIDGSKIILTPYISKATLDIIGLVGFNYEFNSLTSPNELADAYYSLFGSASAKHIIIAILSNYIPFIRKVPVSANTTFNSSIEIIERVSRRLIQEKYNEDKNNKLNGQDLVSILINANKVLPVEEKMTDDELRYQIMTFLFAGHETTATTTCWALHLLSQHPHEQDLLRDELVKAFPDKSKFNPTFDEINSLEYLNCVIKETLRLIPPVSAIRRTNLKDKVFGEYFFPKDSIFMIAVGALHRLPSIWGPTADDFDPKRWLNPTLIKGVTNLNYLPFLTGTRSCIGNKLAINEVKIVLGMLIRNFVFQPVEGLHIRKRAFSFTKPDPYLELIVSKVES